MVGFIRTPLRLLLCLLGYNSPFVPRSRQTHELQALLRYPALGIRNLTKL